MATMTERLMAKASDRAGLRTKIALVDPESGKTILRGKTQMLQFKLSEYTTENVLAALQGYLVGVSFADQKGNLRTKSEGVISIAEIAAEWHPDYVQVPQLPDPAKNQKALPTPSPSGRGRGRGRGRPKKEEVPVAPPVPSTDAETIS